MRAALTRFGLLLASLSLLSSCGAPGSGNLAPAEGYDDTAKGPGSSSTGSYIVLSTTFGVNTVVTESKSYNAVTALGHRVGIDEFQSESFDHNNGLAIEDDDPEVSN